MQVDHCPARTEPGPHHFVEYAPPRPETSPWVSKVEWSAPIAVYCRWCGAWSPLSRDTPAPIDLPTEAVT